jgi:hypothetical protein
MWATLPVVLPALATNQTPREGNLEDGHEAPAREKTDSRKCEKGPVNDRLLADERRVLEEGLAGAAPPEEDDLVHEVK